MFVSQVINGDDLIVDTDFYKWLEAKHSAGEDKLIDSFIPAIKAYTGHLSSPFKGRTDGYAHKAVWSVFMSNLNSPRYKGL